MADDEVVVVVKILAEEKEIMADFVERMEQAEEVEEAKILREETTEEIVTEIGAEEEWILWQIR